MSIRTTQEKLPGSGSFVLPTLTTGSVLFSDGSTIAQDNANFFWDDTNNKLQLPTLTGTQTGGLLLRSTPTYGAVGQGVSLSAYDVNTGIPHFGFKYFDNAGTPNLQLVPTTGSVGIGMGTTTPTAKLHILSTTEQLRIGYDASNYFKVTVDSAGRAIFNLAGTSPTYNFSSNWVGIAGTPQYPLHVYGVYNSGYGQIVAEGTAAGDVFVIHSGAPANSGAWSFRSQNGLGSISSYTDGRSYQVQGIMGFDTLTGKVGFGLGSTIPSNGQVEIRSTTEQLRLSYDGSNRFTATVSSTGSTTFALTGTTPTFSFSQDVNVPDEAYGAGWNGSLEVPTKNALYDKIETLGGGSGITRSVNVISTPTTAGATAAVDYVYFVSGTTTLTLPTAVGNTNQYTVKNTGVATVTIATTSAQTIDGSASVTLPVSNTSLTMISDNANWRII